MNNKIQLANYQQGMSLLIVLILLLLIATVSALAIRSSQMSSRLSQANYANQLLFQSSDMVILQFTQALQRDHVFLEQVLYPYLEQGNVQQQSTSFCVIANEIKFMKSTIQQKLGTMQSCTVSDFVGARATVVSQVEILPNMRESVEQKQRFKLKVISSIPSMSEATDEQINQCFQSQRLEQCLGQYAIPYKKIYADYQLHRKIENSSPISLQFIGWYEDHAL